MPAPRRRFTKPGPATSTARRWGGGVGPQALGQVFGDLRGGRPERLGVDEGGVGRPVAVLPAGGALEMDRRRVDLDPHAMARARLTACGDLGAGGHGPAEDDAGRGRQRNCRSSGGAWRARFADAVRGTVRMAPVGRACASARSAIRIRPRSSADRAPASGAGGAGSSPAEGAKFFRRRRRPWSRGFLHVTGNGHRRSTATDSSPLSLFGLRIA